MMLNNLTGLRFYAAFWVFLYHFFPVYTNAPRVAFVDAGFLGVDVFFVLSGFILTYVYYSKVFIVKVTVQDYYNFLIRRFAKIYPLHLLLTLIFIPLVYIGKYAFGNYNINIYPDTLIQHFLMIHAWDTTSHYSWNSLSWSISAEWFAYLMIFFPMAMLYRFRKGLMISVVLLIIAYYGYEWMNIRHFTLHRYTMNAFPRIVPEFLLGMLIGLIRINYQLKKNTSTILFLVAIIGLILTFQYDFYFHQLCVVGFAMIILALSYETWLDGVFGNQWMIHLGNVSYAFYLTQFLALIIYELLWGGISRFVKIDSILIQFVLAYSINYIMAAMAYKYFEEPVRLKVIDKLKPKQKTRKII